MNNATAIQTSIRPSGLGRRIRATIASWAARERPALTREELMEVREQRLLAERLLEENRRAVHLARML